VTGTEPLAPLIGEWSVEALMPGVPEDARARVVCEWALDGRFLVQRSEAPAPFPSGLCVVAPADDGYLQHYFDSRGVVRLYAMTFDGREWTLRREKPDFSPLDFSQRFTGTVSEDGDVIDARWEKAEDFTTWELDFGLRYTRVR
jgi:hypothetical protein